MNEQSITLATLPYELNVEGRVMYHGMTTDDGISIQLIRTALFNLNITEQLVSTIYLV